MEKKQANNNNGGSSCTNNNGGSCTTNISSSSRVEPRENDVKSGRGNYTHIGNKNYQQLISRHKKAFVLADKRQKDDLVSQIFSHLLSLNPPGRILEKTKEGYWVVKDTKAAMKQIKKALSDNNAVVIEHLKRRGQWKKPAK